MATKIRLHLAARARTLDALVREGRSGEFDVVFIDADKTGKDAYHERCLERLRTGGLVPADNVLWSGEVVEDTGALRASNAGLSEGFAHRPVHAPGVRGRPHDCAKARVRDPGSGTGDGGTS